jgi:hypothetical protein
MNVGRATVCSGQRCWRREVRANTFTSGKQTPASVAVEMFGNFVVTRASENQDDSSYGIDAQYFSRYGLKIVNEFLVNTTTLGMQNYPWIAMEPSGSFIITGIVNQFADSRPFAAS